MLEEETALAEETATAMRELARTVTDAPPLRLAPAAGARVPRSAEPRRWTLWAVPLTAAVVVLALAVALVTARDLSGDHTHHSPGATYPATDSPPTYYVTQDLTCGKKTCEPGRLVVGDTYTGARLATLTPPPGTTWGTVSGAADDRTFVTDTVGYPVSLTAKTQQVTWYLITIRPGSSPKARLTRLPVPATPTAAELQMVSLSPSGRELAVLYHLGPHTILGGTTVLRIYSVATGQLLHTWSTDRKVLFAQDLLGQSNTLLGWVDGDSAVTFTTTPYTLAPHSSDTYTAGATSVRVLTVTASGHDLVADSHAVYSVTAWRGGDPNPKPACGQGPGLPSLATNGKTIMCTSLVNIQIGSGPRPSVLWRLSLLASPTSAPKAARVLYQISSRLPSSDSGPNSNVLWTNPSGSALLIAWAPTGSGIPVTHFGLVSHGKFTPLPTPPGYLLYLSPVIAW